MQIDLADGVVTLKLNESEFDAAWAKKKKEMEEDAKILMPASRLLSDRQARTFAGEIEKAGRSIGRTLEAVSSKIKQSFTDVAARYEKLRGPMMGASSAGVAAGAGAVGLASAASPLASDTLAGSIKLTSAIIGRDFLPLIVELSATIQQAGRWWRDLDQGIKDNIVTTTKMVAISGVAGLAFLGLSKVLATLAKNPLVLLAMGGAAIAYKMFDNAGRQSEMLTKAWERPERERILSSPRMKELQDIRTREGKGSSIEEATLDVKVAKQAMVKSTRDLEEYRNNNLLGQGLDAARGLFGAVGIGDKLSARAAKDVESFQAALARRAELQGKEYTGGIVSDRRKMLLGAEGPATSTGAADLLKSVVMAGASGSQLESATVRELKESNRMVRQIANKFGIDGGPVGN